MSVFLLQNNLELSMVSLLSILSSYAETANQEKPYLVKDGIKIILDLENGSPEISRERFSRNGVLVYSMVYAVAECFED